MGSRAQLAFRLFVVGTVWLLPPAVPAAVAQSLTLTATAGLDGVTRAGRWTPVRVVVENTGAARDASLVVTWGTHVVTRAVSLSAASRRQFDVVVRTSDVQDRVRVEFRAGEDSHDVDAPVRVAGYDEPLTVCVGPVPTEGQAPACTLRVAAARAPVSPRAYDAADQVVVADAGVPAAARAAIATWRARRDIEDSGDLSATRQLTRPVVSRGLLGGTRLAVLLLGMASLLGLLTIARLQRRVHQPLWTLAGTFTVVLAAAAVAWGVLGRLGPGSAVTVRHTSMVQQLGGVDAALVTSRAVVMFPAWRAFSLRALPLDGALLRASESDPDQIAQHLDEDGTQVIDGTFGFAARRTVEFEGMSERRVLDVQRTGATASVRNVSETTLEDCRFADGFSPSLVWQLAPGETAEASNAARARGPIFSCSMREAPLELTEAEGRVVMDGTTVVVAYDGRADVTGDDRLGEETR